MRPWYPHHSLAHGRGRHRADRRHGAAPRHPVIQSTLSADRSRSRSNSCCSASSWSSSSSSRLHELRPCRRRASDELVELQLQRSRVAVLRVLQEERDEECHLRRGRVHRQLPRIGELKHGTEKQPESGDRDCGCERPRRADHGPSDVSDASEAFRHLIPLLRSSSSYVPACQIPISARACAVHGSRTWSESTKDDHAGGELSITTRNGSRTFCSGRIGGANHRSTTFLERCRHARA